MESQVTNRGTVVNNGNTVPIFLFIIPHEFRSIDFIKKYTDANYGPAESNKNGLYAAKAKGKQFYSMYIYDDVFMSITPGVLAASIYKMLLGSFKDKNICFMMDYLFDIYEALYNKESGYTSPKELGKMRFFEPEVFDKIKVLSEVFKKLDRNIISAKEDIAIRIFMYEEGPLAKTTELIEELNDQETITDSIDDILRNDLNNITKPNKENNKTNKDIINIINLNKEIFGDENNSEDDDIFKEEKKKNKKRVKSKKTVVKYNSSRVIKTLKKPKKYYKRHGVLVCSKKKAIEKDERTIKAFLKEFIPGNSSWKKEFRKDLLNRWMRDYVMSKKRIEKIQKRLKKEKYQNTTNKYLQKSIDLTRDLITKPIDHWNDPTR